MTTLIGLVAELGRNLPVCGKHLGGSMDLFPVAGRVRGDLRGLRPLKPLRSMVSRICWLRGLDASRYSCGVALDLGSAAPSSLDLIAEIAEPEHQFGLIDGGGKLLAIEESSRLKSASRCRPRARSY